ncbi:hypothetical protein [Streptomyces sp. NPDC059008]|uniref:hypothetical protein n=1 Tax=Streptomyces sp. NPDC059008 TaxID=3346693 RepID=UPI0036A63465
MTTQSALTALPRPAPRQVTVPSRPRVSPQLMPLNNGAALQVAELDEPWAEGVQTGLRPGLFDHITTGISR